VLCLVLNINRAVAPASNKDGKISAKHRNTTVWTLRKTYGSNFAPKKTTAE